MGDDSEHFSVFLEIFERVDCLGQKLARKRAESFVQKERVHAHIAARKLGDAERERKAHEEFFPAAQIRDRTVLLKIDVLNFKFKRKRRFLDELVAVRDSEKFFVRKAQKRIEREALHGHIGAVGFPNPLVHLLPRRKFFLQDLEFRTDFFGTKTILRVRL